jgi:hypothetical protein
MDDSGHMNTNANARTRTKENARRGCTTGCVVRGAILTARTNEAITENLAEVSVLELFIKMKCATRVSEDEDEGAAG